MEGHQAAEDRGAYLHRVEHEGMLRIWMVVELVLVQTVPHAHAVNLHSGRRRWQQSFVMEFVIQVRYPDGRSHAEAGQQASANTEWLATSLMQGFQCRRTVV